MPKRPRLPARRSSISRQVSQVEFRRGRAIGIDPLDDLGPAGALVVVLQITMNGADDSPAVFEVEAQNGIENLSSHDGIDIVLDLRGRNVLAVSRQAAGPHHAPETLLLDDEAGLIG